MTIIPQKQIELVSPREGLVDAIQLRIATQQEISHLRRTFALCVLGFALSATGLAVAFVRLVDGIIHSGMSPLLSLLFSDTAVVMNHWEDFGFSLLESVPVMTMIIALSLFTICLNFSRLVLHDAKDLSRLTKLSHS